MSEFVTAAQLESEVDKGIKELKGLIKEANEQSQKAVHDKVDKTTFEKIETLTKELEAKSATLQGHYDKLDAEMQKFMKEGSTKSLTNGLFARELTKSIEAKAGGENFLKFFESNGGNVKLRLENITGKAVGTMTTSASLSGTNPIPADYIPSIVEIDRVDNHIRRLFRQGTTVSNTLRFVKEVVGEGGVGMQTEGSAKSQMDRDFAAVDHTVKTIAGFIDISTQLLDDMSVLQSFLPNMLQSEILEKEDSQFLFGDGTGANIGGLGISGNYTAFAGVYKDTGAQIIDLLMQAITQLDIAHVQANGILLYPTEWLQLYNLKDSTGAYLRGLSLNPVNGQLSLLGVPIFKHTAVTAGKYFVANWAKNAMIFDRMGIDIRFFEQNNDNVEKNLVTVRAEERLAFPILRATNTIYGDVATDIAIIKNWS